MLEKVQATWQERQALLQHVAAQQVVRSRRQKSLSLGVKPVNGAEISRICFQD